MPPRVGEPQPVIVGQERGRNSPKTRGHGPVKADVNAEKLRSSPVRADRFVSCEGSPDSCSSEEVGNVSEDRWAYSLEAAGPSAGAVTKSRDG